MSLLQWILLLVGGVVIVGYTAWWYRTREEHVSGWGWAAVLRAAALLTAWLILVNPSLPAGRRAAQRDEVALLDASYSMSRSLAAGRPNAWGLAADSVRRFAEVWLFGGSVPRHGRADSLPAEPIYAESRLAPALRAAAAAGARRVVVFTDGMITDPRESAQEAQRRGLTLSVNALGGTVPGLGISGVSGPFWIQNGDTAEVHAEIVGSGVDGDSVRVEVVDEQDRVRVGAWAPVPEGERFSTVRLQFPVTGRSGYRRFAVRLSTDSTDAEPRDDRRPFYVRVSDQPEGPVLVSLRPDWEPSFLVPNLDRLTDAPTTAYLWLADSLVNLDGYRRVPRSDVRRRALAAPLLVIHGFGADAPEWARDLVENASRVLVLAAGRRGFDLPGWEVRVGQPAAGEWYASPDIPSSPLALDLSGVAIDEMPPLLGVRTIQADRSWVPLALQRARRGEPRPAIAFGFQGRRRFAVAAAEGYWRWAFRPGPGRQLYRTMWTGVAGWLLARESRGHGGLEPRRRIVARGEELRWTVLEGLDSLTIVLQTEDGQEAFAGTAAAGDSLAVSLPPARYRYRARAYRDEGVVAAAEGPAEVEAFSDELLPRPISLSAEVMAATSVAAPSGGAGQSRGLATLGWPYLVLIALFCAEWAVRRVSGLL
jgi:hypothetical protein